MGYNYYACMQGESSIRKELEPANITVMSRVFTTVDGPFKTNDLFVSAHT
jgi:hypothetical protein